jgi:hypothetical protein
LARITAQAALLTLDEINLLRLHASSRHNKTPDDKPSRIALHNVQVPRRRSCFNLRMLSIAVEIFTAEARRTQNSDSLSIEPLSLSARRLGGENFLF